LKGNTLKPEIKIVFLERLKKLPIKIYSITVEKRNVEEKLRKRIGCRPLSSVLMIIENLESKV